MVFPKIKIQGLILILIIVNLCCMIYRFTTFFNAKQGFVFFFCKNRQDVVFPALKQDPSLSVMDWTAPSLCKDPVAMLEFLRHDKAIFPWLPDLERQVFL